MNRHLSRRRAVLAVAAGILTASCSAPVPSPDPGNRQLHALAAEPVFARLPPSATRIKWAVHPARQRTGVFVSHGWEGPGVTLTFRSPRAPADVFRFYAARAAEDGWTVLHTVAIIPGKEAVPGSWTKNLTGKLAGTQAFLSLYLFDGTYTLSASSVPSRN